MSELAPIASIIPINGGGPLLRYQRHSLRRASFWVARETPYYFLRPVSYRQSKAGGIWFQAQLNREIQYWREKFKNSQSKPLLTNAAPNSRAITLLPNMEEYAIYPSKNWLHISLEFSQAFITKDTFPLPYWWMKMSNWEKRQGKSQVTVCQPEDLVNILIYPYSPEEEDMDG